jgi:hypothetical protein
MRRTVFLFGLLAALSTFSVPSSAETVWFEIGEIEVERNQSFLVPLSDPEHIAHARALIRNGGRPSDDLGGILIAQIRAGGDGFNRDLRDPEQRLWRWHVASVEGFSGLAIELCDGWPGFIEENPEAYIANTGGAMCLWGYTVKSELASAPLFSVGDGVDGAWMNPAAGGQGVFLDAYEDIGQIGLAWFTWTAGAPGAARSGEQLWFSGVGPVAGNAAEIALFESRGGEFNGPRAVESQPAGSATLRFTDCDNARLEYRFSAGGSGVIPLQRLVPNPGCRR